MSPTFIVDLDSLDLSRVVVGKEGIRQMNPQRLEMEQIDGILVFDIEQELIVTFKDVRADEFWVRGHIPGRPLLPGVLICECAAQTCSYYYMRTVGHHKFLGFGGMESVKFRDEVRPGDRLLMVAKPIEIRPRISRFQTQGIVDRKLVFEAVIVGVIM